VIGWLLDTNVVSTLRNRGGSPQVETWTALQPQHTLFLSLVSIAEIRFGIESKADSAQRQALTHWLENTLRPWLSDRILGLDEETMVEWRRTTQAGRSMGYTFGQPDLLIAATAKVHDLCVVTRNVSDFVNADVAVFDPWNNVLQLPGRKSVKINGVMMLDRLRS
jgi:toxin FitB